MGTAYNRRYQLTLARPRSEAFFGVLPNALVVSGLEIQFKVERTLEPTPNTAQVSVFNLDDNERAEFQKKPLHVRLDVGYQTDSQLSRLIEGDLILAATKRENGNVITTFSVGDGERAYVDARVGISFNSGVNIKTAIGAVADSMGLKVPTNASGMGELLKQFSGGLTLRGPSRDAMSKLLKGSGVGWSMQDGQLQLLRDTDSRAGLVELISPLTGLIGAPDYAPAKEPFKPSVLKFKHLLRPQLIPGARVKVESDDISGLFRLVKVSHTGDFRDNDWYTDCEANPA